MARGDAVARLEDQAGLEPDVIDEGAVLAAEVLDRPVLALVFKSEVLPGEPGIFRKTKLRRAGAADRQTLPIERNGPHLAVGTLNQEFLGHVSPIGSNHYKACVRL